MKEKLQRILEAYQRSYYEVSFLELLKYIDDLEDRIFSKLSIYPINNAISSHRDYEPDLLIKQTELKQQLQQLTFTHNETLKELELLNYKLQEVRDLLKD